MVCKVTSFDGRDFGPSASDTFTDDGTDFTINPPLMNGGRAMTGTSAAAGSFTSNDSWSATLTAAYSGLCLDCSQQQWSLTGSRL